ncbi:MAG: hypothetical protein WA821_15130 [Anaerolineales bacterium]
MTEQIVTTRIHGLFLWIVRIVAALALAMAVVFLFLWILQPANDAWIGSLLFGFFCVLPWLAAVTYVEMSDQYILVNTFYGRFRIDWDEVEYVETNGHTYAFTGKNKRVAIMTSEKLNDLMRRQIENRKIKIYEHPFVPGTHMNARVKG